MAKFRVTLEYGNGYHCSCCRQTWTETEDFDDLESVQDFVNKIEASKEDVSIECIEKGFGDEIEVKPQMEVVEQLKKKGND